MIEGDQFDGRAKPLCLGTADIHRLLAGFSEWIAIDACADRGKGDCLTSILGGELHGRLVGRQQQAAGLFR